MFRAVVQVVALALMAFAPLGAAEGSASQRHYRVIVHPSNPVTGVDRTFLQDAFLKKTSRWRGEGVIHPADLAADSPVRVRFSEEVIGRSVKAIKAYWQQRIFAGRDVPPPEFDSDKQVVDYVLKHPGGVGYVSATADLSGTKAVAVTE